MQANTILKIISFLIVVLGALPLIKQYTNIIPAVVPTAGIIYEAALIIIGLIGLYFSFKKAY